MSKVKFSFVICYFSMIGYGVALIPLSSIMTIRQHHQYRRTSFLSPALFINENLLTNPANISKTLENNKNNNKITTNNVTSTVITSIPRPVSSVNAIKNSIDAIEKGSKNVAINGSVVTSRRDIRDVSNFEEDEIGWTNINEEVDMTIPLVLSHFQELGMTHFKLPDMKESISIQPLFITYSAGLSLYNGAVYNLQGIYRIGDAMMTYQNRAFQFRLNLIIRKLQFDYDFLVQFIGVAATGTVIGSLEDILISSDFSVDIRDPVMRLNDFQVVKFGNIIVQLNHNKIIQELSTGILTPVTNLFRDRITATTSEEMKQEIGEMIADFSRKDQLGIKKFMNDILYSLTGNKNTTGR